METVQLIFTFKISTFLSQRVGQLVPLLSVAVARAGWLGHRVYNQSELSIHIISQSQASIHLCRRHWAASPASVSVRPANAWSHFAASWSLPETKFMTNIKLKAMKYMMFYLH